MHPHMIMDAGECEQKSFLRNKVTAIIPTFSAPLPCLLWAVFSLLTRSQPGGRLEHIIVSINGPDKRTGDPKLQDQKQAFLEELRDLKWGHRDMPLTVQRTWSRLGHCQAIESALSWLHTDSYIAMHDDTILLKKTWETLPFFENDTAIAYAPPLLCQDKPCITVYNDEKILGLPHMNTAFLLCRKAPITETGARWIGYHVPCEELIDLSDNHEFCEYHEMEPCNDSIRYVSMDIGAWIYYELKKAGHKFEAIPEDMTLHMGAMSWSNQERVNEHINSSQKHVLSLEHEIKQWPEFLKLYKKYMHITTISS